MEQLTLEHEEASAPLSIRWRSFELRPAGSPPMPAEYRARIEAGRPQLYAVARERYQREMNPGPFGIDSRAALIGEKYAESAGCGVAFHDGVMAAYWSHAHDISDRAVLAGIAAAAGMDRDAFLAALDDPTYDRMVQVDIDMAREYGLSGVPALIFNDRYLVSGAQPVEVLRQVVARIAQDAANAES